MLPPAARKAWAAASQMASWSGRVVSRCCLVQMALHVRPKWGAWRKQIVEVATSVAVAGAPVAGVVPLAVDPVSSAAACMSDWTSVARA